MASDEKRSAIEDVLATFERAVHTSWHGNLDVAREELRALRHEAYMSRCRGDVLAEMNDHLRAENAAMREALRRMIDRAEWVSRFDDEGDLTAARTALGGSND